MEQTSSKSAAALVGEACSGESASWSLSLSETVLQVFSHGLACCTVC